MKHNSKNSAAMGLFMIAVRNGELNHLDPKKILKRKDPFTPARRTRQKY